MHISRSMKCYQILRYIELIFTIKRFKIIKFPSHISCIRRYRR